MRFFVALIMLLITSNSFSQPGHTPRQYCPSIIVPDSIGQIMVDSFKNKINRVQNLNIKVYDKPKPCKKGVFKDMLEDIYRTSTSVNGIRIYLAISGKKGEPYVPDDYDNTLVMIYTGIHNKNDVGGRYYIISPDGSHYFNISHDSANSWVKHFQTEVLPQLNFSVPETNTKSFLYTIDVNRKLFDEVRFQLKNSDIEGVRAYFGCYPKFSQGTNKYVNRILVGFSFTDKDENDRPIEKFLNEFGCRIITADWKSGINANTGTPCPPNTNCGTVVSLGH